jgi:hypothetical protein
MNKYIAAGLIILALLFLFFGCSIGINKFIKHDTQRTSKVTYLKYGAS